MSFDPSPVPVDPSPSEEPPRPEYFRCAECGKASEDPADLCKPERIEG